jgi:hypothetical protein
VYAFGDADYSGSRGGQCTDGAVVGIAVDPVTGGYWLVTSKGAVYPEGAVINYGSASALQLKSPIVAIAAALNGSGYWLAAQNGDVYSYGVATGTSESHVKVYSPVVGISADPSGHGYWLASADGAISNNGTTRSYGEVPSDARSDPITAFSSVS